jgi:DHA2 family multidrug resistance protein
MAIVGIPPSQAGSASALYNMIRNLGGSVGIAVLATMVQQREHYHFSIIAERITNNAERTTERLAALTSDTGMGHMQAVALLARSVRRQAEVMAYADAFWVIGAGLVVAAAGTFLLKRAASGAGGH